MLYALHGHILLHDRWQRVQYVLVACFDGLRLSRHCDEGEQDGDDGLLVHFYLFVIGKYLFELRFQFVHA